MANQGKVAIITGGGSGIGRAAVVSLLKRGYRVALCGRRVEPLNETVALSKAAGANALIVQADVTKSAAVNDVFAKTVEKFGRVDVVFNNAGIFPPRALFEDIKEEDWNATVAVNLNACFFVAQAAFRIMKAQAPQGGRIINNGSISAHVPRPNSAPYTATKHAITGLTRSLSLDGRKYNIACGQIDVGNAETPLMAGVKNGAMQASGQMTPEPTMNVDDVGEAVAYMAELPLEANVQFMTIMATAMPYIGRG
jgi:NAD(P)-dependent dehydrogenase (short-subunit alcohol dehydrogenase family)